MLSLNDKLFLGVLPLRPKATIGTMLLFIIHKLNCTASTIVPGTYVALENIRIILIHLFLTYFLTWVDRGVALYTVK